MVNNFKADLNFSYRVVSGFSGSQNLLRMARCPFCVRYKQTAIGSRPSAVVQYECNTNHPNDGEQDAGNDVRSKMNLQINSGI